MGLRPDAPMCFDDDGAGCGARMSLSHTLIGLRGEIYVWKCPGCGGMSAATVTYGSIAAFGRKNLLKKWNAMSASDRQLLPQAASRLAWIAPVGPIIESRFHGGLRYEKHHKNPKRGDALPLDFWKYLPDPVKSGPIPFVAVALIPCTMAYVVFLSWMRPLWLVIPTYYCASAAIGYALYRLSLRHYPHDRLMALLAGWRSDSGESSA